MIWRMAYGTTDIPPVQRHQGGVLEHCQKDELVQRLGQYEDTGLTPEEVRQLSRKDNRFQTFNPD